MVLLFLVESTTILGLVVHVRELEVRADVRDHRYHGVHGGSRVMDRALVAAGWELPAGLDRAPVVAERDQQARLDRVQLVHGPNQNHGRLRIRDLSHHPRQVHRQIRLRIHRRIRRRIRRRIHHRIPQRNRGHGDRNDRGNRDGRGDRGGRGGRGEDGFSSDERLAPGFFRRGCALRELFCGELGMECE